MSVTVALDLGTTTGYAIGWQLSEIESGCVDFSPKRTDSDGMRFLRFRCWLHDLKRRANVLGEDFDLILFERVDFVRSGQVYAAHVWGGFWAILTAWAEHHGIECRGVAVSTLKKQICGNGRAKKPAIIAAVRALGYSPKDSNEADALALLLVHRRLARAA